MQIVHLPPPAIVRNHFVQIFSVCMALHCSKNPGREKGSTVLESSILKIAEMSENERDKLIKKHMVWSFYLIFLKYPSSSTQLIYLALDFIQ